MSQKTNRKAIERLEALYAKLPRVECKGLCFVACGPVPMTQLEADRIRSATPKRRPPMMHEDITCVYLTSKRRCSVYDARPLMCRVWGVIKSLSCMHGCIPERWLTPSEFLAIAQELERIGGDLFVTTTEGLKPHKSYREIQQTIPDEQIEAYDERTR